jgi:uncharacterized protein (DUF4415 family)
MNPMRDEYDFSDAKPAKDVPALAEPQRGRPGKTRITINIDTEVLDAFRERADAAGMPYQPVINAALGDFLARERAEDLEATLRRVIREELAPTADET